MLCIGSTAVAHDIAPTPNLALTGPAGTAIVHDVAATSDGGYIVVGQFTLDTPPRSNIIKLNSNFEVDPGFVATVNGLILAVHVMSDQSIVIGGQFTTVNGVAKSNLAKLTAGGALNSSWLSGANNVVRIIESSGNDVYVGGFFNQVSPGSITRNGVAKFIGTSGSVDTQFQTTAARGTWALRLTSQGLYIGGFDSGTVASLFRASSTSGATDPTWSVSVQCENNSGACFNPAVLHIDKGADGFIYFSGIFNNVNSSPTPQRLIARVQESNGTLDTSWQPTATLSGRPEALEFAFDDQNHIYVAMLGCAGFAGGSRCGVARVSLQSGLLDTALNRPINAYSIVTVAGGTLAGGEFAVVSGEPRQGIVRLLKREVFSNGFE